MHFVFSKGDELCVLELKLSQKLCKAIKLVKHLLRNELSFQVSQHANYKGGKTDAVLFKDEKISEFVTEGLKLKEKSKTKKCNHMVIEQPRH